MAILRAGPWGNLDSPHEDEPAVKDDQTDIYPVNCARSDWPNQPWRLLGNANSDISIDTGTAALGSPIVAEGDIYATVYLDFNWQATQDFDVTLQWDILPLTLMEVYSLHYIGSGTQSKERMTITLIPHQIVDQ